MARVMMAPMARGRFIAIGAIALVSASVLTGCDWRVESEPEAFRTPSAMTVLRDDVAAAESALLTAATATSGDLGEAEAEAVPIRLDALGGVSPTSSPRPSADFAAAFNAALASARQCVQAAGDDPLGSLCASIELSHWAIAAASGTSVQADIAPDAGLVPGTTTSVGGDALAQLALEHDKARALYEVSAARAAGSERTEALARSAEHRERAAALLALPGVADLTQPAYNVPAASTTNRAARMAAARDTEVGLAQSYSALLVTASAADRGWLANAALTAYVAAAAHGLTPADVPALPGAIEPSASPSASAG